MPARRQHELRWSEPARCRDDQGRAGLAIAWHQRRGTRWSRYVRRVREPRKLDDLTLGGCTSLACTRSRGLWPHGLLWFESTRAHPSGAHSRGDATAIVPDAELAEHIVEAVVLLRDHDDLFDRRGGTARGRDRRRCTCGERGDRRHGASARDRRAACDCVSKSSRWRRWRTGWAASVLMASRSTRGPSGQEQPPAPTPQDRRLLSCRGKVRSRSRHIGARIHAGRREPIPR